MITGSKDTWGQTSPLDERSSLYTVGTGSLGRILLGRVVLPWDGLCCLETGCAALGRILLPWDGFGMGYGAWGRVWDGFGMGSGAWGRVCDGLGTTPRRPRRHLVLLHLATSTLSDIHT